MIDLFVKFVPIFCF